MTNKLRDAYRKASKADKGRILDRVVATTGLSRSSARRNRTGPRLPAPKDQIDKRTLKARAYGDDTRMLLEHVWMLMGMPCGKYLVVMFDQWLPLLAAAGGLDKPIATDTARAELAQMSAATVDRYLRPVRERMRLRGISTTETPWQRVKDASILTADGVAKVEERIAGVNPADLTRQINKIQTRLTEIAQAETEALAARRPLDLESLEPSINRLAAKKRKPSRAQRT